MNPIQRNHAFPLPAATNLCGWASETAHNTHASDADHRDEEENQTKQQQQKKKDQIQSNMFKLNIF
jgi:hypothetical protein